MEKLTLGFRIAVFCLLFTQTGCTSENTESPAKPEKTAGSSQKAAVSEQNSPKQPPQVDLAQAESAPEKGVNQPHLTIEKMREMQGKKRFYVNGIKYSAVNATLTPGTQVTDIMQGHVADVTNKIVVVGIKQKALENHPLITAINANVKRAAMNTYIVSVNKKSIDMYALYEGLKTIEGVEKVELMMRFLPLDGAETQ